MSIVVRISLVAFLPAFLHTPLRCWARYDLAMPGTFLFEPPAGRVAALARDCQEMRNMFLDAPASFDMIMETLGRLEARINRIA